MVAFNKYKVLSILAIAAAAAAMKPAEAHAEGQSATVASGYLFTDFGFLGSNKPVANYSADFGLPFGATGNFWVQVGEDEISRELDLTASKQLVELGPLSVGAEAAVFYTPEFNGSDFVVYTAQLNAAVDLPFGLALNGTHQWYWGDLEDTRFEVSVSGGARLSEHVGVDFEIGHSWIDSGDEPDFLTIGLPIAMDELTIRPFGKFTDNGGSSNAVGGVQINW